MTTLRPHIGTGRAILPGPERMQDLRELMSRAADPQLPGLPIQPFPERRSSAGQLALVAVPTVAVLVGSALAVGSATRGAEPAPRPQPAPASVTARSVALPDPAAVGVVRHELLLTSPSGSGVAPAVLTRATAGALAGTAFERYAYTPRAGAAPATGGPTVLAGARSTVAAPATTTLPAATTTHHWRHDERSGTWHRGADPPGHRGWSAAPALGKGAGSATHST